MVMQHRENIIMTEIDRVIGDEERKLEDNVLMTEEEARSQFSSKKSKK